LSQIC